MSAAEVRAVSVEASLVFADLSDFTPLTERLARRGRHGAEELTDLLNALFAPTIDAAVACGGDLLKFGGDSLLFVFQGAGHADRAVAAGSRMRSALRRASGARRAGVGMSIGIASGGIDVHVVGHRNRELVLAGPAVRRCLELEAAASKGEILVDTSSTGSPPESLPESGLSANPPSMEDHQHRQDIALLDPLVERAIAAGAQAEHRRAVVAFVGFEIDAASPRDGVHRKLHALFTDVQEAAAEFGICVLNCDVHPGGGKLTLTAGAPLAHGDDADRMLECALRLVSSNACAESAVRIGINEGRMFVGAVGSPTRAAFTIMGDSVNTAARVMARASPGEVLASMDVLTRTTVRFRHGPISTFPVKGKEAAVTASVVESRDRAANERGRSAAMKGRRREVDLIARRMGMAATDGTGSLIDVVGEPGVGKSRLIREVAERESMAVAVIECGRYLARTPYGAVAEAVWRALGPGVDQDPGTTPEAWLRPTVAGHAPDLLPWLPFVGVPLGIDVPETVETAMIAPEFRAARIYRSFADFVTTVLDGPRLLVVEDAHWLDAASHDLMDVLAATATERGWVVVSTRRFEPTGWIPREPSERIELAPLDSEASRELAVELLADVRLADHLTRELTTRSNGNPLFLEELVRAVASGDAVDMLPDRVETLIAAHVDRLATPQRNILKTAAVLGARFERGLLEALVAVNEGDVRDLDAFLAVNGDEVRFRHALYRDAAYQSLPVKERRRIHMLAAAALEGSTTDGAGPSAELLAVHLFEAAAYARAAPYLRVAAARARADLAPFEASRFLERALVCIGHLGAEQREDRADLERELGELYCTLGRYPEAERLLRRARSHTTDPVSVARLRGLEGKVARSDGRLSTAVRRYRRGLVDAPEAAHAVRAELGVGLAAVFEQQGRHRSKLDLLHDALGAATLAADTSTVAHAHLLIGNTYGDLGTGDAEYHLRTALDLFQGLDEVWGVASARNNLGVEAYYAGDWIVALDHYQAALDAYRRTGDEYNTAMALNNIGEIHSDQGRWDLASDELGEARRLWSGSALGVAFVTSNIARLRCRTGDLDEAEREFAAARSELVRLHADGYAMELDARRAVLDLVRGEPAAALERCRRTLDRGTELQGTVRCQLERTAALACLALGRDQEARTHLHAALELANTAGAAFELAATLVASAEFGDDGATRRATEIFEELGVLPPARRPY